jgi:hypothetical protein
MQLSFLLKFKYHTILFLFPFRDALAAENDSDSPSKTIDLSHLRNLVISEIYIILINT